MRSKIDNSFIESKDDFKDLIRINEASLKEIWDNKEDEIWDTL